MNRAERDSFTAATDQTTLAYGESACLETPPDIFAALDDEFKFDVDLTANEHNHLLPKWFGPGSPIQLIDAPTSAYIARSPLSGAPLPVRLAEDALSVLWPYCGTSGFSNPPYGAFVHKILTKAVEEQAHGFTSVFLLPLRVNKTFKSIILQHATEIRYVDERIKFWYQGQPKPTARVPWTKHYNGRPDTYVGFPDPKSKVEYVWYIPLQTWLLQPAGALFDSIVVVFAPKHGLHFGARSSVWHWSKARREKIARG